MIETTGKDFRAVNADCIEFVRSLPDDSVDMIVYSPPFESLFAYSDDPRDMSNCSDSAEFQEHYGFLAKQLARVLKPGRIACVHCMVLPSSKTREGFIGLRDFPGDLIRAHQRTGLIFHSKVVIWKCPVVAVTRTKALGLLHKQLLKDSAMSRMGIPDEVLMFRKPGTNAIPVTHRRPKTGLELADTGNGEVIERPSWIEPGDGGEVFPVSLWQKWASPVWMDIDQSDVLPCRAAKEEDDAKHLCPLQLEVYRRCMRLYSNPGDTILEPFGGIGSGSVVAIQEGRKALTSELKASYFRQLVANLQAVERRTGDLFANVIATPPPPAPESVFAEDDAELPEHDKHELTEGDLPDDYAKFAELYPMAPDAETLTPQVRRAMGNTPYSERIGESIAKWHPSTAAFQEVAHWARVYCAHIDTEELAAAGTPGGLTIPTVLPTPKVLQDALRALRPKADKPKRTRKPKAAPDAGLNVHEPNTGEPAQNQPDSV